MVRALPDSLQELIGFGGVVRVQCRKCGREARFSPMDLSRWFRTKNRRDDWKTIRTRFVCRGFADEGCGSRDVSVTYELEAPDPPRPPPSPVDHSTCPAGIDFDTWEKADSIEKKRLVRRLRS
jgi:hypothetical protein